jgi:outer membrane protein OmpA-like peptidoglycan-associated protein
MTVSAQKDTLWRKTGKWSALGARFQTQTFGISENKLDTCNCAGADRTLTQRGNMGLLISYYRNVDSRFAYSVDFGGSYGRVGTKKNSTLTAKSKLFTSLRGDLYYHLGKERQMISPYLHTGLHTQIGSFYASMPIGAGMRWMMKKSPVFITSQIDYGIGLTSSLRNNLQTALGVYINLGSLNKPASRRSKVDQLQPSPCDMDTDMDGVPDAQDGCPRLKGSIVNGGCPVCDTDGDGIVDEKDKCPTVPGSMSNQGCPTLDTDGDGVVDEKDLCPTVVGPVKNEGCPVSTVPDRDKDGIADNIDVCPDVPGTIANKGCPESVILERNKGVNNQPDEPANDKEPEYIIYFDFDKDVLKLRSIKTLNDVLDYMTQNPSFKVHLRGHTDLEGNIPYNQDLSSRRVQNAKAYLIGKGIDPVRIKTDYFGKSTPVIETFKKSLGWRNRRVEISIIK